METCVTATYLESCHIQNLRNIRNPVKHIWSSIFLRTLCNSGIFRTLPCSEPEEYSESCQASIWCSVSLMNPDLFRNLVYSEPWHILKPWYIQNPVKYIRWSILFRNFCSYSIFRLMIHSKAYSELHSLAYSLAYSELKTFKISWIFKIQLTQTHV